MDEFLRNVDGGGIPPSADEGYGERVVPAEGDPAVADYRARHGTRDLPRYRFFWMPAPVARRRGVRWWLGATLVVALGLLLIKPLAVLAAVLLAVLLGVVVFGLLAAGTLLLAARIVLGGHTPWPLGHLARHE